MSDVEHEGGGDGVEAAVRVVTGILLYAGARILLVCAFLWPFVGDFSGASHIAFFRYIGGLFGFLLAAVGADSIRRRWFA